ncbi:MAG: hypothetical protein OEZ34_16485 [Spirochaetia bacterium]|nr:hypothetical protein [Spirochaetia bacterium]
MKKEKDQVTKENTEKVVDLNLYRIKKSLKSEGFEVVTDENGKLKLVLRIHEV